MIPRAARAALVSQRIKRSEDALRRGGAGVLFYVDDKALTRDCVARQLATLLPEFTIVPVASSEEIQTFPRIDRQSCCILYNVHWHHVEEAEVVHALSLLQRAAPEARTSLISDIESTDDVLAALRHGAKAYVPTSLSLKVASEIIRLVHVGGTFVPASALMATGNGEPKSARLSTTAGIDLSRFTRRQVEVLNRLWQAKQNKAIAYELKISESTVKVHIRQIMKKLKATNRTQVVLLTRQLFKDGHAMPDGSPLEARTAARSFEGVAAPR